jgi:tetratricopeptide (TPR) repeat protein
LRFPAFVLAFLLVVSAGTGLRAGQDLDYGRQLFREGSWSLAYQTFEAILSVSRDEVERNDAWYYSILCRYQLKDYEQARSLVYLHLKESPFSPYRIPLMILLGDLDREQSKYSSAIRQYMKVVRRYPKSPEAWTARIRTAEVYEDLDRSGEAEDIYLKLLAVEKDPGHKAELRFRLAAIDRRENRPADALEQLRNIVLESVDPSVLGRAQYETGCVHRDQKEWSEAVRRFERLIALYPDHPLVPDARYGLGWCFEQTESWDQALASYGALSNARPELRLNAEFRRAVIFGRTGRSAESLALYTDLATNSVSPRLAEESRQRRVKTLSDAGRSSEALVQLSAVTDRMFRLRLEAEIRYGLGDYAGALSAYEPFLKAGAPGLKRDESLMFAAGLYQRTGRPDDALAVCRTIYQTMPDSALVPSALGTSAAILVSQQRYDDALVAYNRLLTAADPVWTQKARAGIADIYMRKNRYREAADLYADLAASAVSNRATYWYDAGLAELALDRKDAAMRMFRNVFSADRAGPEERKAAFRELASLKSSSRDFVSFVTQVWPVLPEDVRDEAVLDLLDAAFQDPDASWFFRLSADWIPRLKDPAAVCRARYLEARARNNAGDYVKAREGFSKVRNDCGGTKQEKDSLFELIGLSLELDDPLAAESSMEELVRLAPSDPLLAEAAFEIGRHWFRKKETVRSRRWFKLVEWDLPKSEWTPRAVYWSGLARLQEQSLTNALANFENGFSKYPDSDVADLSLLRAAETCARLGRNAQAVLWFKKLLKDYPGSSVVPAARSGLAASYTALNNRTAAEALLREIASANADVRNGNAAKLELALLLKGEGDWPASIALLTALEQDATGVDPVSVALALADAFRMSGDCAASRPRYAKVVLAGGPATAEAMYYLGVCAEESGDVKSGREYYVKVIKMFPATVWSGRAELKLKKSREAGK